MEIAIRAHGVDGIHPRKDEPVDDERTPVMMFPVRPHGAQSPRPVGDVTYMGPCVAVCHDPLSWAAIPRTPRSIGEMTYMGPSLRPDDFRHR